MGNSFDLPEYEKIRNLSEYAKDLRLVVFQHGIAAAQAAHIHHSTISRYENGETIPPPGYLAWLAGKIIEEKIDTSDVEGCKNFLLHEINTVIRRNNGLGKYAAVQQSLPRRYLQHWDELKRLADDYLKDCISQKNRKTDFVPIQHPPRVQHFTDRKKELVQLLTDLQPGRLVTLCGPGGVGKSALAAEAIWQLAPGPIPPSVFPDGIIYHDFYRQPRADLALEAVARAYGEEPLPTPTDAARRALGRRQTLLVLDGAENADNLPAVLSVVWGCGVLVISRTTKDAVDDWHDLTPLTAVEAAKLLQAWGRAWAADEVSVGVICELLGGLPLAIKLVGRYLVHHKMRAEMFLKWLQASPLQALDQKDRQVQSIPLLLKRSLAQVSEGARQALAVIGLLALQPFTGAVIAAAFDWPVFETEDRLGELVSYGMLLRPRDRYEVSHRLIHTYAQQNLKVEAKTTARIAAYYTRLAEEQSRKGAEGYCLLVEERLHLMGMLDNCVEREEWQAALNLALAVDSYLNDQGHWTERLMTNEIGVKAAQKLGDRPSECIFLDNLGRTWDVLGEEDKAITVFGGALDISAAIHDLVGRSRIQSRIIDHLGSAYYDQGQVEKAIEEYLKALAIAQENNDPTGEDTSLCSLGGIYTDIGPVEQAIEYIKQALSIARALSHQRRISIDLGYLGNAYVAKGQIKKAIECYDEARDIAEKEGNLRGMGSQLLSLGKAYSLLRKTEQAQKYYEDALLIAGEIGDIRMERNARAGLDSLLFAGL